MGITLLLQMALSGDPTREIVVCDELRWTTAELDDLSARAHAVLARRHAACVAYIGLGGAMLPLLMLACARAGRAFTPLNYRLSASALQDLIARLPEPLVVVDPEYRAAVGDRYPVIDTAELLAATAQARPAEDTVTEADDTAVMLFTSGTTSQPKAVELSHANLVSYVTGSVEFLSAEPEDAALIAVPPYHIAGVSAVLSNLYAGRTMVYLPRFAAERWIALVDQERITTATVVPTMLERIISALEADPKPLPSLRNLAYGGAKVALPLVRRALDLLPDVGFVNAYGLTETSSTIAVLTPGDHRSAHRASDPAAARRLGSVGRPVPGVQIEIRSADGTVLGPGEIGELYVRGEQVSGRYAESGSALDDDGWFPTRDRAAVDDDGYLFILGRADDTIIRGGENIAPAELEDVLVEHPAVRDVAVVGADDAEWGQIIVAVIVPESPTRPDPEQLRAFVRERLRGSRTPDRIVFCDRLPTTATGKVLRREILAHLPAWQQ
ncbi:class I adenylate-forming enzyme family protein [Mycolicibacter terrae]|uniref:class I adenylate-forming enzyme family protein n=1 Tax=Mycolicibacter terrae TaxID=1788 RepID=UPI000A15F79B|nr:fatty acid--CoA ligase family protein [Mycolicibacter terrae]ORW98116.1 AMP-dependent synthetase [Mycolicibacter terrae]